MKRHLVIKLSAIGDVAFAAPAVRDFQEKEGGEIHWVSGEIALPLVKIFPFVHKTYSVSDKRLLAGSMSQRLSELWKVWKQLAGQRFDTCLVLHSDWRFRLPSLPVRARRKIYMDFRKHRSNSFVVGRSQAEEYRRILLGLEEPISEPLIPVDLTAEVQVPPQFARTSSRPRIAVVPGGARNVQRENPQRRWPIENCVILARYFTRAGYEVALVGGPGEQCLAEHFQDIPVLNTIAQLSLPELLGFYTSCDLVISPDTGPLHLARLTRVPVIALYGPVNPSELIPKSDKATVIWGGKDLPCRPCYDGREFAACTNNLCMKSIEVETVIRTAETILQNRNHDLYVLR